MLKLFNKKPVVVTKSMTYAERLFQQAFNTMHNGNPFTTYQSDVDITDFTLTSKAKYPSLDGSGDTTHVVSADGHYTIGGKARRFEAELRVRVYSDGRPSHVEFEDEHKIADFLDDIDKRWHRVEWSKDGKCRTLWFNHDPVSSEWSESDYLLRLDQLPFGEVSSHRVAAALYSIGITRLGYLIRWTEEELERTCRDISIVAGAKKVVEAAGYRLGMK